MLRNVTSLFYLSMKCLMLTDTHRVLILSRRVCHET